MAQRLSAASRVAHKLRAAFGYRSHQLHQLRRAEPAGDLGLATSPAFEIAFSARSLPDAGHRARDLRLGATNKGVLLTICCEERTRYLEKEFRDNGFTAFRQFAKPTFSGFLADDALL